MCLIKEEDEHANSARASAKSALGMVVCFLQNRRARDIGE